MNEREELQSKGYDVQTRDLAISWQCTLEWHNQIKTFFGATEAESLKLAGRFVAKLEQDYRQQQVRLSCEGCGEGGDLP